MNELATYTQSRAVGAPGSRGAVTSSLSTSRLTFDEPALTWADVVSPEIADAASSRAIGSEAVVQVRGAHRTAAGFVQKRVGYRAFERGVTLIEATRPLTQQANGSMKPAGPWKARASVHNVDEESMPTRRTGQVEPGVLTTQTAPAGVAGAPVHREAESAVEAEAYLPSSVQASLAAAVPKPGTHVGVFLLWSKPSGATQEVNILRMDASKAVVVHATRRHDPTATWTVRQTTYSFEPTPVRATKTLERGRT